VASEGIFLAVVDAAVANEILATLKTDPNGKNAAIIGEVSAEQGGKVTMRSRIGGTRMVSYLPGEQLPRIC
jgi:hydrogenase expression/formation protein HypE